MRPALLTLLFTVFVAAAFGQTESDFEAPSAVSPIDPVFPADLLATFHGTARIHLFAQIDQNGRVKDIESFGPWIKCGKSDPTAEALEKIAVQAVRDTAFFPGQRDGKAAEAALIVTISRRGTLPASTGVLDASKPTGGVVNGRPITLPKPKYPSKAKAYRIQGAASIEILIDEEGKPISAKARRGHPLVLGAAAKAACDARYTPTLLAGEPVKVGGVITYNFVP